MFRDVFMLIGITFVDVCCVDTIEDARLSVGWDKMLGLFGMNGKLLKLFTYTRGLRQTFC